MAQRSDETRTKVIGAAQELYHHQGFHRTTLADVAAAAAIPLGSLYYYFRTKEALALAVIHAHAEDIRQRLARWDEAGEPRQRLLAMLSASAHYADIFARYGCPYGTLAVELDKSENALVEPVGKLLELYVTWTAEQYANMGAGEAAHALAIDLVATMQGAYLLANALREPALLRRELARLAVKIEQWPADQ